MQPGSLLRMHRRRRRRTQLDLATAAGVSPRHLSFIETGRSRPGRAVLAALARALELPHRETNLLLRAAGERPLYPQRGLAHGAAQPLRDALERMLEAHMPWPAMVTDHAWRPLRANPAFDALVATLAQHAATPPAGRGMMEWLFAADGVRPLVANWETVGPFLLQRVRREAAVYPDLDPLLARIEAMVGPDEPPLEPDPGDVVLPLHLRVDGASVRLFSLLAAFGSALDADLQALRMEYFCPADRASGEWLERLAGHALDGPPASA